MWPSQHNSDADNARASFTLATQKNYSFFFNLSYFRLSKTQGNP
jgi:hypothetical protein